MRPAYTQRVRPCPVCGAVENTRLFQQSFERMADVGFLSGYDVLLCKRCGMGFAGGIPTQAGFDEYYRGLSKYDHEHRAGHQSPADELRLRETASDLIPFIPESQSRVLEIGCSTGLLLSLVRAAGFQNIHGLDPSPRSADAAWSLFQVPVQTGGFFENSVADGSVDFAIAIAVLEHVEDVSGALQQLRRVLAPGGVVFAEVPDASRFAGRPDAPFQEFSVEHINFFSKYSLSNLFRSNGFSVLAVGETERPQDESLKGPVVYGVYQLGSAEPLENDPITGPGLRRYIEESSASDGRIRRVIEDGTRGRQFIVWGTGTHTQRLLATGAFDGMDISAFVDSNPKYHGHELHGIPIVAPESLQGRSEPILISTRGFQTEIRDQIRGVLKLKNELILLYDVGLSDVG